uniref:AP complex mu/sigma subunit domain-containing protein n=2 Tax=Meloidogyne enterolobii TaxID=390850 RepID=A0A6V7VQ09_MELEN|nr:unnamed protein product [Meloidogyne enterolobii]
MESQDCLNSTRDIQKMNNNKLLEKHSNKFQKEMTMFVIFWRRNFNWHYATLYFVFCVDSSESELGILDLIQVFVETLDRCFENVCELDMIFHVNKVHNILNEIVMGGMVLETNMNEILLRVQEQDKIEKQEAGITAAPARAVSAVKNMNIPQQIKDLKLPDLPSKIAAFKNPF